MFRVVILLSFLIHSFYGYSSDNCLACNEGVRVCFSDINEPETSSYIEVCPGVTCSDCLSVGFNNKRFSYKVNDDSGFIWFGGDGVYIKKSECERDRREDIRCH